jgi:pSer/pThr/pTyr-binding forkhead associated (FHA) protein
MEPASALPPNPAGAPPPPGAELIVQDGRPGGTRRPLSVPLTLIGRSAACDVRLPSDEVEPVHCALVHGSEGLLLRDLGESGVLVNDTPAGALLLRDGDTVTVGPFRLTVSLPLTESGPPRDPDGEALERERDALRVQAAAVVAQQAALTEAEGKLEQRRLALQRQEEQLAGHLEAKRSRLLDLQQRVRDARLELQRERTEHAERTAAETKALGRLRHEVAAERQRNEAERQRLAHLHQRLRQRYHDQTDGARAALRRREEELDRQQRDLQHAADRLEMERAQFRQEQLHWNGEVELGRRQLRAGWDDLRARQQRWQDQQAREEADLRQRQRDLERRTAALAAAEYDLAEQCQQWEDARTNLQREIEGLENRARHCRRKLTEAEHGLPRPEAGAEAPTLPTAVVGVAPAGARGPVAPALPRGEIIDLERLASDLADQRLQLAEACERLLLAQEAWRQGHQGVLEELEAAAARLQERELEVALREEVQAPREFALARREEEALQLRQHLEAALARVAVREGECEGERQRLLEQVRAREALVERRWLALVALRRRWRRRRREEVKQLRADLKCCEAFRRQYAGLWEECFRRQAELERRERDVAARSLALEQHHLQCLGQVEDPAATAKHLERLKRRWVAAGVEARRELRGERRALKADAVRFLDQLRQLERRLNETATRERELSRRRTTWEHEQALAEDGNARLRRELQSLQAQRTLYERQLAQTRDEIERVARFLIEDEEPPSLPIVQAA